MNFLVFVATEKLQTTRFFLPRNTVIQRFHKNLMKLFQHQVLKEGNTLIKLFYR